MSQKHWLVGALVPGLARDPQKKLPADAPRLLAQLERWRAEAAKAGRVITRICVACEAGRDGFWLAPHGSSRGPKAHGCASGASSAIACPGESRGHSSDQHSGVARASAGQERPA